MNADVLPDTGIPKIVKIKQLVVGRNPRGHFDPQEMDELIDSVRASGIAQPILVRPLKDGTFRIIAGERRVRAATVVFGEEGEIAALVRECTDDEEDVLSLIENVDRAAMSGAEEAEQANRVLIRAKGDKIEAAAVLGWKPEKLFRRLALMQLTPECRKALTAREIKLGHAELLASVPQDKQNGALEKIISAKVSVFDLKRQVAAMAKDLKTACFDKSDCAGCQFNSAQQQALFSESLQDGVCTNPACFDTKVEARLGEVEAELKTEVPKVIILRQETPEQPIRLVMDGKGGVGEEQFHACKGCGQYGASVSAMPGSMGEVERGLCFDAGCNIKKVSAYMNSLSGSKPLGGAFAGSATSGQVGGKKAAQRQKSATSVGVITTKVKEYRVEQWRKMAAKVTYANPEVAMRMLVSLALAGYSRHIDPSKLREAFVALSKNDGYSGITGSLKGAFVAVSGIQMPVVNSLAHVMAASAFKEIDEQRLREGMEAIELKVADHWKLNEEYVGLLTKSEMEALAVEIGLKDVMGEEGLKKALALKKDQAVAALLAVEGFVYEGVVPKAMRYDTAGEQASQQPASAGDEEAICESGNDESETLEVRGTEMAAA